MLVIMAGLMVLSIGGCRDLLTKHNIDLDGAKHGKKLYSGAKNCTSCHGINLDGNGFIPSCYSCHDQLWNKDDHTVYVSGVPHLLGVSSVDACRKCHGQDLKGSKIRDGKQALPSCYECHDDLWTGYAFHSINEEGYMHAPGWESPMTSGCTDCHGPTLQGGTARSCYSCHGDEWNEGHD